MFNADKDNVSMYGAPTFPNEGNGPGFPSRRRPWPIDLGDVAIENELKNHLYCNQELKPLPGIFRG